MSFVLQLGSVEGSEEPENGEIAKHVPTSEPMNIVVQLTPSEPQEEHREDQATVTTSCSKPTIVYPGNQARIQAQNLQSSGASSPGVVVATIAKPAAIVYPVTKFASELQKDSLSPTSVSLECPTRVIQQAPQQPSVQQKILQIITSAPTLNSQQQLPKPVNNLVNSSQPAKVQMTYDAQTAKSQQSTTVFQPCTMVHKFLTATNVKTITPTIQNIQRLQTKSGTSCVQSPVTNIPNIKTITGVGKNMVAARVQAVPAKPTPTVVQQAPPVPTNQQHGQRIQQQNPQKIVPNQKQNPTTANAKNNANHKSNSIQQTSESAKQVMQKVANLPAKVQRQAAIPQQQQQKPQLFQVAAPNNIQKTATAGAKPLVAGQAPPSVSQSTNNVQQIKPQGLALMQKCQTTVVVNPARTNQPIMNICKSASVPNVAKVTPNSSVTINKTQYVSQSPANLQHTLQLQQIISQCAVQQSQSPTPKQQTVSLQAQRLPANTNIQPKINVVQQQQQQQQQNTAIASMPMNQKGSVVVNTKGQAQHTQMLLRLNSVKNSAPPGQLGGVKGAPKNPMTPVKTAGPPPAAVAPPGGGAAHQNRPVVNAQPVKIIQQQLQNVLPSAQTVQKQPGCIKTIPPQKPHQRNHTPVKPASSIKTSLNTNMSCMKSQPVSPQKTSIKTLLPQQPNASSHMMAHKNQAVKVPPQSLSQKQLVTVQYPQQVARPHGGQIKTMLPIISPEMHREMEAFNEAYIIAKGDETQESTGQRMPLPYECLQFVLQDHNYGAPPPRTPSPKSSPPHPIKQQSLNGAGGSAIQHPFIYNQAVNSSNAADDAASAISSEAGREAEPEGEETETAPEGEGDDEDSITRCICEFEHDDGYMICCDRCVVWQHVDCMGIDRSNIPDEYLCERCRPRRVDRQRARTLQMRKREELMNSDTSSDTSSTSSADTDVGGGGGGGVGSGGVGGGGNAPVKKRLVSQQPQQQQSQQQQQQQQQQLPVPRRKADPPPPQLRKLNNNNTNSNNNNNNNNNNVAKRQRREQHPRQASANRKKETVKRGPGKRKVKRRMSVDGDEDMQDAWGSNMAPLRQWIEKYEEAVTNHYSPELRARISSIKVNGTHGDLRQSNISNVANGKCRLNVHSNSLRFLVATMYLPPNTPVVELRGKYMLSTQHRPSHPQGRQHTQRPGPFVFFYRLPREGTEVCVDTRTYGNDARFVRRSCKPNAEVKHCIEKGMLHLYIVTTTAIEKNVEITIRHEQHDLMLSPNSNSSVVPVPCACGNARLCQMAAAGQLNLRRGSNGALAENADGRERRRRGRRNTTSEDVDSASPTVVNSSTPATATVTQSTPSSTVTAASTVSPGVKKIVTNPPPVAPAVVPPVSTSTTTRVSVREESQVPSVSQLSQELPVIAHTSTTPQESKKDKKKMTREERKMEAIMKAFERMEKAEQRKQEVQARNAQRKESGGTHSDNDEPPLSQPTRPKQAHLERPMRRKRRKGRARTTSSSHSQNSRRTRLNSADSDLSSCEENMMIQSPPALSQMCGPSRDNQFSPRLHTPTKEQDGISYGRESHNQVIPTAADLLLALANSNMPGPSSPSLHQPPPSKSPTCDSGASTSSQSSTPSTPLSSACLLVAAAVGPLAPGFKFPKTKKVMMNEWLRESPDPPPQSHVPIPHVSPNTAIPMVSSPSHQLSSCRQTDFLSPSDPSPEFLTQSYAAKGLATLVQAANSVAGICDSPPQRKHAAPPHTAAAPVVSAPPGNNASSGSAKKRWLRQAISEECDSPNSRPESPPSEMVAPPKKRRFARESISSDNYTPPTTPTHVVPDLGPLNAALGTTEADYVEQHHSPLSLEGQIKMECDSEPLKDETNSESEKLDFYKVKAAIEIPEDILSVKPEETSEIDNKPFSMKVEDDCTLTDSKFHVKDEHIDEKNNITCSLIEYKTEPNSNDKSEAMDHQSPQSIDIKTEIDSLDEKPSSMDTESAPETATIHVPDSSISAPASHTKSEQNIADMPLELSGSTADLNSIDNDENLEENKVEVKAEDTMSIDEFDVEAQMKKITGDDGNDYKEKEDMFSDRDKSMDGIEGLMDSSKEDSDSEDRDFGDVKFNEEPRRFKDIEQNMEERAFKELETLSNNEEFSREVSDPSVKSSDPTQPEGSIISSEESMFDSIPSNMDCESVMEPPKIFQSILPLSERIRKKTDSSTVPKKALDFEAAIIESTLDMESIEVSENGERKSELSTALRELLEAKIDDTPLPFVANNDTNNEDIVAENTNPPAVSNYIEPVSEPERPEEAVVVTEPPKVEEAPVVVPPPAPVQPEIRRLKDPRTAIPNEMRLTSPKTDLPAPVKRKVRTLSISEYRKRKQQSETPADPEPSNDTTSSDKSPSRGRSDSASSGTSSLSSDEDNAKATHDTANLTNLPLFTNSENEERKGGEEGTIGWSAAPTLVERQRENLTERLKREFGLFLSDDEEERARKQGLTAEAILKARQEALPAQALIAGGTATFSPSQLPPQSYIPPPGTAPIHCTQFPAGTQVPGQYQSFPIAPPIASPVFPVPASPAGSAAGKQAPQFLVPQAPPGANPYPPQFTTTTAVPVPVSRFSPTPSLSPGFNSSTPSQKPYYNHPHSTPRT